MPYKDPNKQRDYQRAWIARRRTQWIEENGPCTVCGGSENLQVDHVDPRRKETHHVWSWKKERREAELARCQVLCEKCHKEKGIRERLPPHGTHSRYTSSTDPCRCYRCKAAHAARMREWRHQQKSKGP